MTERRPRAAGGRRRHGHHRAGQRSQPRGTSAVGGHALSGPDTARAGCAVWPRNCWQHKTPDHSSRSAPRCWRRWSRPSSRSSSATSSTTRSSSHTQPIWPGATLLIVRGRPQLRRRLPAPLPRRPAVPRRAARPAHRAVRLADQAGRRPPGPAAHRADRQPVHLRPEHDPEPAQHDADADRQRRCCSSCPSIVMFFLSPLLALISLAVGPGAAGASSIMSRRRLFPASWDAQQKAGEVAGVVEGAVTGVRVVKGFGQEDQEIGRLEGVSRLLYAARVRAVRMMARFSPALGAIPALGQVGVLALGGWMAIQRRDHPRHVPGLRLLPGPDGQPGPGADQPDHHRPGGAGQRRSGSSRSSTPGRC